MARMRARSDTAREGLTSYFEHTEGVTLVRGWGRLDGREKDGRFRVMVGDQVRWRGRSI